MKSALAVILVAGIVVLTATVTSSNMYESATPLSPDCQELCKGPRCSPEPSVEECGDLNYTVMCGRRVCFKGPNEKCGTPYNKIGRGLCAGSLHCNRSTGKCSGCIYVNGPFLTVFEGKPL
ncbi:hypothetical protein GE061_006361 [Apolygus lucorum]|uniref:Neuroparsin n=1 Tax=Apolygus lucorum TaxID=248454 RepID=A0A6A4J8D0_APOLU|nr:hypothetical protein GE061_006361 [Apolygus lucorum]